ncbi:MAG TPA: cytochrome c [Myxococcota bacterium]|nr:cytochrome c [Myxococcota bacterium]HNH46317.1 cytochrome c [Myxococcota bacterium]
MRHFVLLATLLVACGGEEKKPAPAPAPAPAAPAPAPAPPPAPAAPAQAGPYTPDDFAKAAYEKAKAAGADAKPNPKAADAAAIAAGKADYEAKCASCHGASGMGDGMVGAALPQKPANFSWKERWEASSVGTKHWIVMNGVMGTAMAPLGLTDDQAWEVLAYIDSARTK